MAIHHKRSRPSTSRRRAGRGGRRNNPGRTKKLLLLGAVPLVVIGGGGFALAQYMKIEKIDDAYCFARADQHQTAIFLDNSMQANLPAQQLRDYQTGFDNAYAQAPANTRIAIFTTASDISGSLAKPVASICKPAATTNEQADLRAPSKPAPYLANRAREAKAHYSDIVGRVLADAQDTSKAAGDSPILEQLQAISRYSGFTSSNRSLVAITDGIQNSEIARFCAVQGDMPRFAIFEQQARYKHVKPRSLAGVNVNLLLVESATLPQKGLAYCTNNEVRNWWPAYFTANGAASVESNRLRHGTGG